MPPHTSCFNWEWMDYVTMLETRLRWKYYYVTWSWSIQSSCINSTSIQFWVTEASITPVSVSSQSTRNWQKWEQKCLNVFGKHSGNTTATSVGGHLFTFCELAVLPQLPCFCCHLIKIPPFPSTSLYLTADNIPEVLLCDPGTFPKY